MLISHRTKGTKNWATSINLPIFSQLLATAKYIDDNILTVAQNPDHNSTLYSSLFLAQYLSPNNNLPESG